MKTMNKNLKFEPIDVDLSWPKEKLLIQSSVYPEREYSFNELATLHAEGGGQTNLERIENSLKPFKANLLTILRSQQ